MKSEVAVMLFYKMSGLGSSELERSDVENLKSELQENYITHFRDTGGPQAGGIVDTAVEIFTNEYFQRLTNIVVDGLIFDLVFNQKKSIVLKPLIKAFQKMEAKTDCWDYTQVRFNFNDTTVVIFGAGKIFTSVIGNVFPEVLKHSKHLIHKEDGFPTKICMPLQCTDWGKDGADKWITTAGDGQEYFAKECLTFWGLEYGSQYNRKIYDFEKKKILEIEWE